MGDRTRRTFRRLFFFSKRSVLERELEEELEVHRSFLEKDLLQSGGDARDAHQTSRKQMGNMTLAKENSRDLWGFRTLEAIFQDLRHSIRGLLRNPVFTCTAVFSLALGIGANTAIFTAIDILLFKPLAVKDPASLVTFSVPEARGNVREYFPLAFANQLRSPGAFSDVIATDSDGLSFSYGGRAERIMGEVVTPNFFSALGLAPVLGQAFTPDVAAGKWAPEAVLSYSFWKVRFGGDPRVIGRVIRLNTYPFTIVGVSPSSFLDVHQGQDPELRIPVLPPGREIRQIEILGAGQEFDFIARLALGVSRVHAQAVANSQLRDFARTSPDSRVRRISYGHLRLLSGERGWPELANDYEAPVIVLFLLALAALLIACANVASMVLARAAARRREFAVRSSLGAGRSRLIRQVLVESVLLSLSGGVIGLVVARWVAESLLHFLPQGHIHFVLDLRPDTYSFAFTFLLSIVAAVLFGFSAAIQSTRGDLAMGLKTDSSNSIGGSSRLRKTLVAFQIAFSLALLFIAGLFIRTVSNLRPTTEYPHAQSILVFTIKPQQEIYSPDRIRSIGAELIRRVSSIPGVQGAGIAENGPFASRTGRDNIQVPGHRPIEVARDLVTPGFLNAVELPLLSGRDFSSSDKPGSPKVVILSQHLAQILFPNENVIGRTIELVSARGTVLSPLDGPQYFRVIGIVADAHYYDVHRLAPVAFFAFQNDPPYMPTLHVRVASSNPDTFIPAIRREFDAVDTGFPVFNIRTLEVRLQDALARERMIADLSSAFGGLALVLAAVGLYGVLAYSVARRTREIGVRIALGSKTGSILWLVGREAFTLVGIGAGAGFSISVASGELLASRLYGVAPADPVTLLAATVVLLLIAIVASSIPALRASRIDPVTALRYE
jgi:predicted permease